MSEKYLCQIMILSKNYNIMQVMTRSVVGEYYIYDTHQNVYRYMKYLVDKLSGNKDPNMENIPEDSMSYESRNLSSAPGTMHFYEGLFKINHLHSYDSENIDEFYR